MVELLLPDQHHILILKDLHLAIIPTVLIPLTAVTVGLTSLAGLVAGWFGIKLHAEGPKQLLEVLLRKQVLISMLTINIFAWGVYKGYVYVNNLPSFLYTIERNSKVNAIPSVENFSDSRFRNYEYRGEIKTSQHVSLKLIKELKLNKGAFRSGAISGNSIFYGVDDGLIYEIDKNNLKVKRKFFIGKQVTTRPVILNNKIYTGEGTHNTHHARIYSFDLKSGTFNSAFRTKGHTEGQPVIGNLNGIDLIFITAGSDGLYALTPDLKQVWHKKDGHLDGTVSIDADTVYAGTGVEKGESKDRSYAVAYSFLTGKLIWKKELPLSNWMHPVISQNDVCYVLGEIYTPSTIGLLYCLNKKDGTPHFSVPFDSPLASKPFYIRTKNEEMIFVSNLNGDVCGININKKEKMWCRKTSLKSSPDSFSSLDYDPVSGALLYPSYDNGLFAIAPLTGEVIFHWVPGIHDSKWQENSGAVTIEDNRIYQMDLKGNVRLFNIILE